MLKYEILTGPQVATIYTTISTTKISTYQINRIYQISSKIYKTLLVFNIQNVFFCINGKIMVTKYLDNQF